MFWGFEMDSFELTVLGILILLVTGVLILAIITQIYRWKFSPGVGVTLSRNFDLPVSSNLRDIYETLLTSESIGKIINVNDSHTLMSVEFIVNGKPQEFIFNVQELRLAPIDKKGEKESTRCTTN
jgi:hypothetical protein